MEITFSYPDVKEMENLQITNSRKVALRLIQAGYTVCLIPQMFHLEDGLYGLYPDRDAEKRTPEEAESWLSEQEENIRRCHSQENIHPVQLDLNYMANQTP